MRDVLVGAWWAESYPKGPGRVTVPQERIITLILKLIEERAEAIRLSTEAYNGKEGADYEVETNEQATTKACASFSVPYVEYLKAKQETE